MPRSKEERAASVLPAASDKMTKLLEDHKEKQDVDRDVKWRQANEDEETCGFPGQVEKLLADWDNPIYKRPPQVRGSQFCAFRL